MAKKCKGCEEAEKCKYWSEFPAIKLEFFKIMLHDFEHQLRIPQKFIECLKEKLSPWCTLIGPSKNEWRVKLSRQREDNGRVIFSDGWADFVSDHEVEIYDFLVFRFVGDSSFEVSVFDSSCCEREGVHCVSNASSSSQRRISCTSTLHANYASRCNEENVIDLKLSYDSSENEEIEQEEEQEDEDYSSLEDEEESEVVEKEWRLKRGRPRSSSQENFRQSQKFFTSKRRELQQAEKQRASKMAMNYISSSKNKKFPMFRINLYPSNVYNGFHLTIPKKWAMNHMLKDPHEVELRVPKARSQRSMSVGCRWTLTGVQQCQLRAGWARFVLKNNLEDHDACVRADSGRGI